MHNKINLERFKYYVFNYWQYFFIIILSFALPAIWLKEGLVISYAESGFTFLIDPIRLLNLHKYIWWDIFGLGTDNARALCASSYHLMTSCLKFLGLSAVTRQYLIFSIIILLSTFPMYCLIIELFKEKKKNYQFFALIGTLFYVLNPFTMNYIWHRFTSSVFGLPLMPLIMLIAIKIIKKPSFKYTFLFAVAILFFSVNAINPGYFIPLFLPMIFYVIFKLFRIKKIRQFKYFGLAIFLLIGLNLWWLLPLLKNAWVEYIRASSSIQMAIAATNSQSQQIFFIIRLLDNNLIHWYGVNYQPGWIEFLIPVLAIVAILLGIKRNKNILFFTILLIFSLFFGKGLNEPGGIINKWIFTYVPLFDIFRNSFEKFGLIIAFSYSFLIPFGILKIQQLIKRKFLGLGVVLIILVLLFGIGVWPMWTGDVFSFYKRAVPIGAENIPTTKVKIPSYWKNVSNYINQDKKDYRIIFLPLSPLDGIWYEWEYGYAGADFGSVNVLFNNPVICQSSGGTYSDTYIKMVINDIFLKKPNLTPRFLSLMNIKYLLVRYDINETALDTTPFKKIKESFGDIKSIKKIETFNKIDLYKIDDSYFLPHFYIPQKIIYTNKTIKNLPDILNSDNYPLRSVIYFNDQIGNSNKDILNCLSKNNLLSNTLEDNEIPRITFVKINPTKYRIKVENAKKPFVLVFSESFHKDWKLYIDKTISDNMTYQSKVGYNREITSYFNGEIMEGTHRNTFLELATFKSWGKKSIAENRHLIANGYANSWYITPEDVGGKENYEIIIEFWPQRLFYVGLLVSSIIFIACLFLLIYYRLKRRRLRNK